MGSWMKIDRNSSAAGVVYDWAEDNASGCVLLDEQTRTIRPCDEAGRVTGSMSISADDGTLRDSDPDPAARRRFMTVAAAIIREWKKTGELPQSVSRTFG